MIALILALVLTGEPTVIPASKVARIADGDHSARFTDDILAVAAKAGHCLEVYPGDRGYGCMNEATQCALRAAGYKVERLARQREGPVTATTYYIWRISWEGK